MFTQFKMTVTLFEFEMEPNKAPEFVHLLLARDISQDSRQFMLTCLNRIGDDLGVEIIEVSSHAFQVIAIAEAFHI